MSIKVMTAVWKQSPYQAGALLIHLALADFANDDGECFFLKATLAAKARMTERQARRILRQLEADGTIAEIGKHGRATVYRVTAQPDNMSGEDPDIGDTPTGHLRPPDRTFSAPPSLSESSVNRPGTLPAEPAQRPWILEENGKRRDLLWEAMEQACHLRDIPPAARGKYNRRIEELRTLGASPQEIHRRAGNAWFKVTPDSLVTRWAELDSAPEARRGTVVSQLMDRARRSP